MTLDDMDEKGYQIIAGFTCFFQTLAIPDDFRAYCERYPDSFSMKPYVIEGEPLLTGFFVTVSHCWIKEVTRQYFPRDWWYDHAYLFRVHEVYFLWVQKMQGAMSYLEAVDEGKLKAFEKGRKKRCDR